MAENDGTSAKRLTIYDLAQIAGTSPSAVSSVLNGTWKKRRISDRLAERITRIAEEQGYAVNLQASVLRRERSRIVGMIVPKYDNRYFGAIAEQFEAMARARDLFPVVTCTRREADLEFAAARALVSYQVESLIVTGATEPDRIGDFCRAAGVRVINLDLPGSNMPSVVSDNFTGARDLTRLILTRIRRDFGKQFPLFFIGGRAYDHNTRERLRGFMTAHQEAGLSVPEDRIIMHGYAPEKNEAVMDELDLPDHSAIFVNSTIALEGVVRALHRRRHDGPTGLRFGCFDWDPFAALMQENVGMAQQDVSAMLLKVFDLVDHPPEGAPQIMIPCILRPIENGEEVPLRS
ncbi:LacI family DNA-binding transcriptional regulator [Paracoccus caeni]|uniref:LacI family DNA-binding transcriptional regulator n=1 Tax=Paracoccus caeni TaxID=657651 RepID=A0A934SGQ4_9RHOB|nr:LacI family DNA-binding transcriptional regulator [Paracoccus caeni]MBK4217527.1 LacI family DNA-binding transcriptional regulator [Paracoccus caeni]